MNDKTHCDTGICNDPACGSTCVMGSDRSLGSYPIRQAWIDFLIMGAFGFFIGYFMYVFVIG